MRPFGLSRPLRRFRNSSRRSSQTAHRTSAVHQQTERLETRTLLTTFNVNSVLDTVDINPGDGVAVDASGNTSLRAAVQEANALAGNDTINLPSGLFGFLTSGRLENQAATGDLDLLDNVTIIGAGRGDTIIDGNDLDRIFEIHPTVVAEFSGVTLQDASASGSGEDGGAVRNRGILTIVDSALTLNSSSNGGGAIVNESGASLTLLRTLVDQNVASGAAGGGAILNRGTASITQSVLDQNTGSLIGGGILNSAFGALQIVSTELTSNRTNTGHSGGGLFNAGFATVTHSTFNLNQASNGGAIYVDGNGSAQLGLTNSTLSGNFAFSRGGGIHAADADDLVSIRLSTITDNFGGAAGGGIHTVDDIALSGSIVAGNSSSGSATVSQVSGRIASNGFNLLGTTVNGQTVDDIVQTDPVLGTLQFNGGPTRTHLPLGGSAAIDNGHPTDSEMVDQRFQARPRAVTGAPGPPDIGAVEVQPIILNPGITDIRIRINGPNLEIVNEDNGMVVESNPFAPDIAVIVNGTDDDNSIIIDFSGGDPVPTDGLTINGMAGNDSLTLIDGGLTTITHTYLNATDVDISLDDGSSVRVVTALGLSELTDDLTATNRAFEFGAGSDVIELDDDGIIGNVRSRLTSTLTIPQVDFRNPTTSGVIDAGDGNNEVTLAGVDGDYTASLTAVAGAGDDVLDASSLSLGTGLTGGGGADTLTGGGGSDTLNGNGGADSLIGGNGNDFILGGSDPDVLVGGNGNDTLRGQGGQDDSLTGGPGDDILFGGSNASDGNDTLIEHHDAPVLILTETSMTGIGTDTLAGIQRVFLHGGRAGNRMDASLFPFFTFMQGFAGKDTLIGGPGRNILVGGAGKDTLMGNDGNDRLRGGGLHDVLDGGAGIDVVLGHAGRDTLTGGADNDRTFGGPGIDTLVESADADVTVSRTALTGIGTDQLRQIERLELTGGAGDNLLDASLFGNSVVVNGMGGNDTLIGSFAADTLNGGEGNDSLLGRDGNDNLIGGNGDDTLNGGAGNDHLDAGSGNDGLSGSTGNDKLLGGDNNDTLYGGDGDDTLSAGTGDDTAQGGLGDDEVNGDDGTDILTGGVGDGVAQAGDVFDTPGETDEFFALNPAPDWVDAV